MQNLLDGLLDISGLRLRWYRFKYGLALGDIFEQLRSDLTLSAEEKGLRLRIRPPPVWLMSDPVLLHRILLNLLGNAVRYTQKGRVLLACRLTGDGQHARIEVWTVVFRHCARASAGHFQRVLPSRQLGAGSQQSVGLGLGLNIVQRTAQQATCCSKRKK